MIIIYSLLLLLFFAAAAYGGTIVRQYYGTEFSWDLEKAYRRDETGDRMALQQMYNRGYLTVLKVGERVDVEEVNRNVRLVRRRGELTGWYIPMECVSVSN